jgi:hypothetical protein
VSYMKSAGSPCFTSSSFGPYAMGVIFIASCTIATAINHLRTSAVGASRTHTRLHQQYKKRHVHAAGHVA